MEHEEKQQVFISYCSEDRTHARRIFNLLKKNGITCWMDKENLRGGQTFTEKIAAAISECQVFVLILTGNTERSRFVFDELTFAKNKEKTIIPYHIGEKDLKIGRGLDLALGNLHWIKECDLGQQGAQDELVEDIKVKLRKNRYSEVIEREFYSQSVNNPPQPEQRSKKSLADYTERDHRKCDRCSSTKLVQTSSWWLDELIQNHKLEDYGKITYIAVGALGIAFLLAAVLYGCSRGFGLGTTFTVVFGMALLFAGVAASVNEEKIRKVVMRRCGYSFDEKNCDILYSKRVRYRCTKCNKRMRKYYRNKPMEQK